ncbi:uracil-DNA glycosylase [Ferrimonas sediminicola]|uniref:uracil-DNA glycosylase n=1 Tax=Ferrimonas sediminicola TaxID=2569538 RepID=UPI00197A7816|nr:uracil-DNA glycosylase [Ferrimonas sediminicola]
MSWQDIVERERQQPYFQEMGHRIAEIRQSGVEVYPPGGDVFNALNHTPFDRVKVVILGQDPYHGPGQAHGLSFSVPKGVAIPPSLKNIYKELAQDIPGFEHPGHGHLKRWAEQGVLLLNTVLTVERGKAHSHARFGWERFTDVLIEELNQHHPGVVFMLWGSHAQKKGARLDGRRHLVLKAPHPSPLSAHRGFFGCGHFSQANQWLRQRGQAPIEWRP